MALPDILAPVVVVGGCGYFGAALTRSLRELGISKISVIDIKIRDPVEDVRYYECDISSAEAVLTVMRKARPATVFHSASPSSLLGDAKLYYRVNVQGVENVLAAARACGSVRALIYTSSCSVVHNGASDLLDATEDLSILSAAEQPDPYALSKGQAEKLVIASNGVNSMLTCALRPTSIFGPGDAVVVTPMALSAKQGKQSVQMGDGTNLFDFVYIDNLVDAHVLAAEALARDARSAAAAGRVNGEAFYITNGEPWPFWQFARGIGRAAGYPVDESKVRSIPLNIGLVIGLIAEWWVWITSWGSRRATISRHSIRYSCLTRTFNIQKAKQRLGYRPKVSMREGVQRAGSWIKGVWVSDGKEV